MKQILIISNKEDVHADFVIIEIRKLGGDVIRINTEDLCKKTDYAVEFTDTAWDYIFNIKDAKKSFGFNDFETIWYRKPAEVETEHLPFSDPHSALFAKEESEYFLRSFYLIHKEKRWVNDFWKLRHASHKLPNLQLAASLGLKVPKTIVTNMPDKAMLFFEKCNQSLITKTFHFSGFVINGTEAWHCFAHKVGKEDLENFTDSMRYAPTLLQEYIAKDVELRATLIGEKCFTAAIHSQKTDNTKFDWRSIDSYQVEHTPFDLPLDIVSKLKAFNLFYGLSFSTFDIVLTPSGEYVFLECNPNGQWLWIEEITGMQMAKEMAKLLLNIA